MKQQRMKRLKIAGIAVVVIIALAGLNFGANKIKGSVAASRAESSEKSAVQQVETEYSKWVANAKACNLKERIDHITSADGYPNDRSVFVGITIEPASELAKFWESEEGVALDCLSQKTAGVQMSRWFTYSNQEIASQQIDSKFLFDETFYVKFARGKLDYLLQSSTYDDFIASYEYEGRGVWEQQLRLTAPEKQHPAH
jgi:hypothetical protein